MRGLTGTCLYKADLRGAILEDADLIGVNLRAPDLVRSLAKYAIFRTTTMPDGSTNSSGCTG
ncbi:MAG: pentapeptide repeat-containing protein [Pseudomonadota bacterium]|nr:pentapeptide repeat-containing protein [Pseudomonadota bacterium]